MRDQLDTIIGQKDCEYSDIIYKYLPIELEFIKNKRYVTLKNDFIL